MVVGLCGVVIIKIFGMLMTIWQCTNNKNTTTIILLTTAGGVNTLRLPSTYNTYEIQAAGPMHLFVQMAWDKWGWGMHFMSKLKS